MAKTIWLRATIKGCHFNAGRLNLDITCGLHAVTGEAVHAHSVHLRELEKVACFIKGMLNSSQNALVPISDGWAPVGKLSSRFEFQHGVSVKRIVNDFSRDGDIECVDTRDDAEKLCLLSQRFASCSADLLAIAEANDFNIEQISVRALRSLKNAVDARIARHDIPLEELKLDGVTRTMVLAGK